VIDRRVARLTRLALFRRNAGPVAIAQIAVIAILLFFAIRRDIIDGRWWLSLPAFAAAFAAPYLLRDWLVAHLRPALWTMNVIAVVAIVAVVTLDAPKPEPAWFRVSVATGMGLYLGCFFWTLSDWRVHRV